MSIPLSVLDILIENYTKQFPNQMLSRDDIVIKVKAEMMREEQEVAPLKKALESKLTKSDKKASKKQEIKKPVKPKASAKKTGKTKIIKKRVVKMAKIAKPNLWRLNQMNSYIDQIMVSIGNSPILKANARGVKRLISEMKMRLNRALDADTKKAEKVETGVTKLDTNVSK